MNNTILLIGFFGVLGLVCLLLPKLIHVLYTEITKIGSDSPNDDGVGMVSAAQLNTIRIIGVAILAVLGMLIYF